MNISKINNNVKFSGYSSGAGKFATEVFPQTRSFKSVVAYNLNKFSKDVEQMVPDRSLYGFSGVEKKMEGMDLFISYGAKLSVKLPVNNPDKAFNSIKRLTLSVYDKSYPNRVLTCLLKKGTKSEILKYLKDEKTPSLLKNEIENKTYILFNDVD